MPRESKALSDMQVRKLSFKLDIDGNPKPDRHPVGGVAGLQLYRKPSGSKSWVLRVKVGDRRKDIGLGSYPSVSLKVAREQAREHKIKISNGIGPIAEQKAKKEAKHRLQWTSRYLKRLRSRLRFIDVNNSHSHNNQEQPCYRLPV